MDIIDLPLVGMLVQLLIIGGIIALVVAVVRRGRRDDDSGDDGGSSLRRVFQYGIAFVALMLAASGLTLLLDQALDGIFARPFAGTSNTRLALGLAMTIVSTPVWLLFWRVTQRGVESTPAEGRTLARSLYVYGTLFVTAAVTAGSAVALLRELFHPAQFDPTPLSLSVVWAGVWLFHWRTASTPAGDGGDFRSAVRHVYQYLTASYALALLVFGLGSMLAVFLVTAYYALIQEPAIVMGGGLWTSRLTDGVSLALVGGAWWWWHWHRLARGEAPSWARQIVLYVVAILGGTAITVASASAILNVILHQLLSLGASTYGGLTIPNAVAWGVVGGGTWLYHAAVVRDEAGRAGELLVSARRTYRYLVAAIGLATLAVGLVTLFGVVVGMLVPGARPEFAGQRWWVTPTSIALTLVIVGAPLWAIHWFRQQALALHGEAGERGATARRIFIFVVFGVAILATIGAASAFLFSLFEQILDGTLSTSVLEGGKWALGVMFTAGAISGYYWQVLREDRAASAEQGEAVAGPRPRRKSVTLIGGDGVDAVAGALAARLGYRVRVWRRADDIASPALSDAQLVELASRIVAAPSGAVLVAPTAGGVQVIPYAEDEG